MFQRPHWVCVCMELQIHSSLWFLSASSDPAQINNIFSDFNQRIPACLDISHGWPSSNLFITWGSSESCLSSPQALASLLHLTMLPSPENTHCFLYFFCCSLAFLPSPVLYVRFAHSSFSFPSLVYWLHVLRLPHSLLSSSTKVSDVYPPSALW